MGCFSFHPRKVITTGEGGMITTNDPDLAEKIKLLRSHGGVKTGAWFQYEAAGFNYRLSDILSAVGVAQMAKLPALIERKRKMVGSYSERLSNIPRIRLPGEPNWGGHIYQSYVILIDESLDRNKIIEDMKMRGIETTIGTYALHDQPFFQRQFGYKTGQLINSHAAFTRSITLPLYPQMSESDLDLVADTLKLVLSQL
jgi:dTDP-4-amino-4,6-dideoxygalactose transaminase